MPLDNYFTKPDYSRQLKQYSGTSAVFSGTTNILEAFYVKSVEIDTAGAVLSDALLFDGIKFRPGQPGGFSGSVITNGFNLSYVSGLTYRVSPGSYRFNNTIYAYTGQDFDIIQGQSGGSRFDLVYISGGSVSISVRTGTTTTNPTVPNLQVGELEVGIIFVPVGFTGGTGSTIIQTSGESVFVYYNNGAGTGIQRAAAGSNTEAPGSFSFAVGRDSDAYAPDSVTLGVDTKASGNSQTVVGTFNIPTTTDYFIVGYGTNDSNRANAFNVTTSGDTYVNKKLFVTNVEIETTGASNGQVLKFDGTKFKPQLETITGATSFSGGIPIFSSITNNTLLFKSISAGTNVTLTESSGTIFINVEFSGASISGLTEILSLTGGTSIISGKTGSTYFLYPIQGSGGTQVVLSNNRILIYSDTSASTTGANVGPIAASGVYKEKVLNELRFRRLTSTTSNYLTIQESTGLNELILFSSNPPITGSTNATGSSIGVLASVSNRNVVGRTLTGTNRASVSQAADLITINSPIEVDTGRDGHLAVYRSSSPIVYSGYNGNIPLVGLVTDLVVKLKQHTTAITSRTYSIVDVKKDADFVMTEGNQTIHGIKTFYSGFTIGNSALTTQDIFLDNKNDQNPYNNYSLFSDPYSRYVLGFGGSAAGNVQLYGGQEVYIMPWASEYINKPINPLTRTLYSASTATSGTTTPSVAITTSTFTVGKLSNIVINDSTFKSGDTAVGVINKIGIYGNTGFDNSIEGDGDFDVRDKVVGTFNQFAFNNQRGDAGAFAADSPIIGNYFEMSPVAFTYRASDWNKTRGIQLGHVSRLWTETNVVREAIDLYISRPKMLASHYNGFRNPIGSNPRDTIFRTHAALFIENREKSISGTEDDVVGRFISPRQFSFTNKPWSIFAEADRAYIGNTLVLYSALTLTSTTRGAWLDIGPAIPSRPQINFASGGTAPTTPRTGDMWFDGTVLKFRLSSSTVNLTSGTTITGGSIGSSLGGGTDVYKTTAGDTLYFKSISSATDPSFLSIVENGDLILISAGTALKGLSALTGSSLENLVFSSSTSLGTSIFDIPAPYNIYYKNLSAGTGIQITDNGSLITINSTVTGGTSGGSISGQYVSGITSLGSGSYEILSSVTNNTLIHRTISAGTNTNISYLPDGTLVINNTGVSGNTSFTGITDITSAGTGNFSVISSITNNKLVYRTISAGTGIQITESNGTLVFVSTASGGTGSTLSGDYLPLSGGTLTGGLSATTISATSIYNDYNDFNTGATVTSQAGRLFWYDTDGTLQLGLKGGNVNSYLGQGLVTRVVNKTSPLIDLSASTYNAVVVAGATGQRLSVKLAKGNNDANSAGTLGIVAEDIAANQEGYIVTVGLLKNLNTTGALQGETWNDGDVLYLSPTIAGRLTNIKPQAPNHIVIIGYVEYKHINQGKIYVKIDNGYELDELHNVRLTGVSNYNILTYDAVTYSSWTNTTLNEVLSKTLLKASIGVTSQVAQVNTFYLYDKITITSSTSTETVTAITSNASISSYTPSIKFFAQTGVTVTFRNSATLKTEGGLDAVIVGDNYDNITFTYNNDIGRYFQTNINNYI